MDLALINLQRLMCHKTQPINQPEAFSESSQTRVRVRVRLRTLYGVRFLEMGL